MSAEKTTNAEQFYLHGNKYHVSYVGLVGDKKHYYVFTHVKHGHYSNPYSFYCPKEWPPERILAALLDDISIGSFDIYDR